MLKIIINRENLKYNLDLVKKMAPKSIIAPVLKSNAYGHGLRDISIELYNLGLKTFSVAFAYEAKKLITILSDCRVQILSPITTEDIDLTNNPRIMFLIASLKDYEILNKSTSTKINVSVKYNYGMNRYGLNNKDLDKVIQLILRNKKFNLVSISTHFSSSNSFANKDFDQHLSNIKKLKLKYKDVMFQCSNSAAICRGIAMDIVRPGIMTYGCYPSAEVKSYLNKKNIYLKPILNLNTKVSAVRDLKKGDKVGYSSTYVCTKKTKAAVLNIGYYNGLDRRLSNKGKFYINNIHCKILGRICMNNTIIDISKVKGVSVGDKVELVGKNQTSIEICEEVGLYEYEFLIGIRPN